MNFRRRKTCIFSNIHVAHQQQYSHPQGAPKLILLPLHAGLSTDEQMAVFTPAERGSRKVIVATNIAEVGIPFMSIQHLISTLGEHHYRGNKIRHRQRVCQGMSDKGSYLAYGQSR